MNHPLRIAIAEDEPMNRRRLQRLLQDCGSEVVAAFGNGLELEEWMRASPEVDALFLDIQMPGLDGLSLRASLDPALPVVFVTAYAEHAVEAIDLEATDYLLKPVTTERLARALDRVRRKLESLPGRPSRPDPGGRIPVSAGDGVLFLDLEKLTHFEVVESTVWACAGEKRFRTRWRTLGEVEVHFPHAGLMRIHRHLLIRPETIVGLRSSGCGARVIVRLLGGVEVEASRGATPGLKERLGVE
jgi:two-component system LytT family response regulator/two-component system response regulator AlgR